MPDSVHEPVDILSNYTHCLQQLTPLLLHQSVADESRDLPPYLVVPPNAATIAKDLLPRYVFNNFSLLAPFPISFTGVFFDVTCFLLCARQTHKKFFRIFADII